MATEKQLAALAKARAARAKKAGTKTAAKKPRKKVSVKAPSRATGKAPSKRLQSRRKKNVTPGYYPNPTKKKVTRVKSAPKTKTVHMLCAFRGGKRVAYWTGRSWDDQKGAAKCYASQTAAARAWNTASKTVSSAYKGGVVTEKK